ncbi:MAG: LdpA C-terminal domain-containing domain [Cyanobacteria bacterium P01_F01_bin.4]
MVLRNPFLSLEQGHWFKLICGASYQYLPAVRNLALVYTLVGADCIDVAAEPAVVAAATSGIAAARTVWERSHFADTRANAHPGGFDAGFSAPWLMVSLNDGEDPHFRKAAFDPLHCPTDCWRPCESICPADAIAFHPAAPGVIAERCYGCGRCLPVCPVNLIKTVANSPGVDAIASQLLPQVDAIEIHTQIGRTPAFARLWQQLRPSLKHLKLVAVSCPDGEGLIPYLKALYDIMQPLGLPLIWQTDGRPMSGDIGAGTTHATIKAGQTVLNARLPGHVQLAGGTNQYTVEKLKELGLLRSQPRLTGDLAIAGVAYGSYARQLMMPLIEPCPKLEQNPQRLKDAIQLAHGLVSQLKPRSTPNLFSPDLNALQALPR